jgi:hypothetical protein
MEINIVECESPFLYGSEELCIILVGPGVIEGKVVFLTGRKLVREGPLHLVISIHLNRKRCTIEFRLTLCEIFLH